MPAYHLRFRHLDTRTITATQSLFDARTSAMPADEALAAFGHWLDTVAAIYSVPRPELRLVPPGECAGSGQYLPAGDGAILLPRPSVTTLLHLFRYHLQNHGATVLPGADRQEDARAWSLSVYHQARPELLARMVTRGRIHHLTPADLTPAP